MCIVSMAEDGFTGYRNHLLAKLKEQLPEIFAGGGERKDEAVVAYSAY